MWYSTFIFVHAVTGGIALLAGCVALGRRRMFGTYLWSLVAMEVFLVLAIAAEWMVLDAAARGLFAALAVLGVFMLWRADRAWRVRPRGGAGPSARYVEHVGFTLVALFDAFVVVAVLDLGAPGWLVAALGVLIGVAGHFVLRTARARLIDGRT